MIKPRLWPRIEFFSGGQESQCLSWFSNSLSILSIFLLFIFKCSCDFLPFTFNGHRCYVSNKVRVTSFSSGRDISMNDELLNEYCNKLKNVISKALPNNEMSNELFSHSVFSSASVFNFTFIHYRLQKRLTFFFIIFVLYYQFVGFVVFAILQKIRFVEIAVNVIYILRLKNLLFVFISYFLFIN